jgi:hypothetical protein
MLTHPYSLWTPLAPQEALERLGNGITPTRVWRLGFIDPQTPYTGAVIGSAVRLAYDDGRRNSWRWTFQGDVVSTETGTWLVGTVGPHAFVPAFSAVWVGGVSLFLLFGTIGFVSDLVTNHGFGWWPLVLVPIGMLKFFVILTQFASRAAGREWRLMDDWLRDLLEVPQR